MAIDASRRQVPSINLEFEYKLPLRPLSTESAFRTTQPLASALSGEDGCFRIRREIGTETAPAISELRSRGSDFLCMKPTLEQVVVTKSGVYGIRRPQIVCSA